MSDTESPPGPPALDEAPAAAQSAPLPLEGGPPPLEEPAAPLPPGLTAKQKLPVSLPPPLEPALPPPPPLAAPARPGSANGGSVESSASPEDIRAAVIDYLRKRPASKGLLNQLGVYLRSRKLAPEGQLKRFLQQHCQGRVVVIDSKTGTDMAQLAEAAAQERTAALEKEWAAPAPPPPPPASQRQLADAANRPPSVGEQSFDPSWLEEKLMQCAVEILRAGQQPAMPLLGQFCIEKLGLQMKGRLKPFLERRTALCRLSDDGRQHVNLTPAGIILGGGSPAELAGAAHTAHPAPPPAPPVHQSPRLGADRVPGGDSAGASGSGGTGQAAGTEQGPAPQIAAKDYKKWDPVTKEIFQFVRSRGVATFSQIDTHVKAHAACVKYIAGTGIALAQWRSQFFLHKRRNIFRIQGTVVSLSSYVPEAPQDVASDASSLALRDEDFPSLSGSLGATPSPSPMVTSADVGPAAGSDVVSASAGDTQAVPQPAAGAASNPLLSAFAAERQAMEQLRDDVLAKLTSFKALSELQKENAGLRAACVTLGRELLSLKSEFTAFQQQTVAALAALGAGAALPQSMPVDGAGPASIAADMSAAAYDMQQQQQQQQQQQSGAQPAYAAGNGAVPSSGTPTAAEAAAQQAQQQVAMPLHMPAAAPVAAPPAPPYMATPQGEILLVGGYDGGTWLDSADYMSPSEGVWASLPLLGKVRSFAAAVATAAEVFVVGGGNGQDWYDSVVRYDRHAGLMGGWTELAPLQVARGSLAAGISGGYLFAYGGGKPKEQYNVVEWYDPQSNRWLPGPALQRKRFALGGASLDGAIYAVGGYDGGGYLTCAERLDPRTDRWELLPAMSAKRGGHAVAAADGCVYAIGGFDGLQAMAQCEVLELRTNTWRPIASMLGPRAYSGSASLGRTIFAVGGLQSDMQTHAVLIECYNPATDMWTHVELPPNANPRRSFLAACGME